MHDENKAARARLASLAESLSRQSFVWPARCIRAYLEGHAETLDEAFGLTAKRARGQKYTEHAKMRDAEIVRLALARTPWSNVQRRLRLTESGVREGKRLVAAARSLLRGEALSARHAPLRTKAMDALAAMLAHQLANDE